MRDLITAAVRTGVVTATTAGLLALVAWLASFGIVIDPDQIGTLATALGVAIAAVAVGLVNLALNWAQTKLPWLATIVSLGRSKETPTY